MPTPSPAAKHHKNVSFSLLKSQADLAQNPSYLPRLSQTGCAKPPKSRRNPLTHLGFRFGSNSRSEPKRAEKNMYVTPFGS
jgi:hypothetical protein